MFKKIVLWNFMLLGLYAAEVVVLDTQRNLEWYDSEDQYIEKWKLANSYCSNLDVDGHEDWRLPTKEELVSLSKDIQLKQQFKYMRNNIYWTSDKGLFDSTTVFSGNGFATASDNCEKYAAICVRNSQ